MHKFMITYAFCFMLSPSYGQKQRSVVTYLSAQYNQTLYDYTIGNNSWGIGLGLQSFFNNRSVIKPTIELTGDIYLMDDKVFRSNPDGTFPANGNDVRGMINLFAGISLQPAKRAFISFTGGPSFIGGQTYIGAKPSAGVFFGGSRRWMVKASYINIFNRTKSAKENFGSLSVAIACKLF